MGREPNQRSPERYEVQQQAFHRNPQRNPGGRSGTRLSAVTKIALGVITPIRAAEERLKFTTVSGGLKMQVRGAHAVQIFCLYTTRPEDVIAEITSKWNERDRP